MRGHSLLVLSALCGFLSCAPPESALRVIVSVRSVENARVRADCLRVTILNDSRELKSSTVQRPPSEEAVFGVRRSDLPKTVKVQASGLVGNCADDATLKLNAQGEAVTVSFPESGVESVNLFVEPPNSSLDFDRDGFVSALKGGPDCNDNNNTYFPGAGQVCANTEDTDCNGQNGCDDSQCPGAPVCTNPPTEVKLTSAVSTMLRYQCRGPFHVALHNNSGVRAAIRNTPVALSASQPGLTFHADPACNGSPVTSQLIPFGQSSFDVYLRADGQAFGLVTLQATAAQVSLAGMTTVEVHPLPVDSLVFTSPPQELTAGQCSPAEFTLQFLSADARPTDVDRDTTITLSSSPSEPDIFFAESTCTGTASSRFQLKAGQGRLSFHLRATRAGPVQLTATSSGGPQAMQLLTVQAASAQRLAFINAPLVLISTQPCSPSAIQVQLQDQFMNPVVAMTPVFGRLTVSNFDLGTTVDFFESSTCGTSSGADFTIAAGSSSVSRWAHASQPSQTEGVLKAEATGLGPAQQPLGVSAGYASKFALLGLAQSPEAGQCSANALTVQLQNSAGNPASANGAVTFRLTTFPATADSTFSFHSAAGCGSPLTGGLLPVQAGQTSAQFFFKGNLAAAAFEVRATSMPNLPGTVMAGNSIRPGPPATLDFETPLSQTAQAGSCTAPYRLKVADQFGNPASFASAQNVMVNSNPMGVMVGLSNCNASSISLPRGVSNVSFVAGHTRAQDYGLTATVAGFSTGSSATLSVTPSSSTVLVAQPSTTVTLTAGDCQQITLTRNDNYGNPAPTSGPASVTLNVPPMTTWDIYPSSLCLGPTGALSMNNTHTIGFGVKPRTAGRHSLTASIPSLSLNANAVTLDVAPGSAAALVLNNLPSSLQAGSCAAVTLRRTDAYGNNTSIGAISGQMSSTSSPSAFLFFAAADCSVESSPLTVDIADGLSVSAPFYARATIAGTASMTATSVPLSPANATATITPAPASKVAFVHTIPRAVEAGACSGVLQVEVEDAYNNRVTPTSPITITLAASTSPVTFAQGSTCGLGTTSIQVNPTTRVQSFVFLPMTPPGTSIITATSSGLTPASENWTVNVGSPSMLGWQVDPTPSAQRFVCSQAGVLQTRDRAGNPSNVASDLSVTPSGPGGASLTFYSDSMCLTPATTVTVPLGMNVAPAMYLVATGTADGGSTDVLSAAAMSFTSAPARPLVVTGGLGSLAVTPATPDIEAGSCVDITITRRDSGMMDVSLGTTLLTVSVPGSSPVTLHADSNCASALSVPLTIASGQTSAHVYVRGRSASSVVNVILTARDLGGGSSDGTATLSVYPLVRRARCDVPMGQPNVRCRVTPAIPAAAIDRSFLVFTSTGSPCTTSPDRCRPADQNVECHLDNSMGMGVVEVVCTRIGTGAAMNVSYQLVSWGRAFAAGGVSVQHLPTLTVSGTTTTQSITAVDRTQSFILASSSLAGDNNNGDGFPVVRFGSDTTVEVLSNTAAMQPVSVQVVSFAGAAVDHRNSSGSGATVSVALSSMTSRSFVLGMAQIATDGQDPDFMCKRRFRGRVGSSSLTFRRGGQILPTTACTGDAVTLLNTQRVTLPSGTTVQAPPDVTISNTATAGSANLFPAVAPHRSITFAAVQGPGGQASGESTYESSNDDGDDTGPFHALLELNAAGNQVDVLRSAPPTNATSFFAPFVVQFDP